MRLRTILLVGLALLGAPAAARAHPGSGIVVDRAGNVFFVQAGTHVVWKLSPAGIVTKFVEADIVRLPHHLVLDREGTLYFASDFDGRIWRVRPDGSLVEFFNTNRIVGDSNVIIGSWGDPFTIDSSGDVYALRSPNDSAIVHITPDGRVTSVATRARFGRLHFRSMAWGADGALYLTDADRVWRIVGDSATPIVPSGVRLLQAAGLAVDHEGNIYVADFAAKRVVRLGRDGTANTPPALAGLSLSGPWGVTIAPDGSVYVLDHPSGGVAVWRVRDDAAERLYSWHSPRVYLGAIMLALLSLLLAAQTMARRPGGVVDWLVWMVVVATAVGALYWVGRGVVVFSWLRHPILLLFLFGGWRSWRRIGAGGGPARGAEPAPPG
ncbi:MAG: NHL repeat-containing protein [Gemmatimonadales bacterium]